MFAARTNWNLETNALSKELARHRAAGKPLIDLTASNPTACGFHYRHDAILQALANPSALHYTPDAKGLETAREAVAAYYSARKIRVPIENIILTTSTSEAYSFVFRTLCNPGDEILIPEPSYPLFTFLAEIQDVALTRYPLLYDYGWQVDFDALEKAATSLTRAIVVVHPNNPTGHFTKPGEIEKLNQFCAQRNLAVIADEVFLDFACDNKSRASFASNPPVLTFTTSGLSKIAGLPQMKAAWLVASGPPNQISAVLPRLELIADTYLSMSAPVQLALPTLLALAPSFHKQVMNRVHTNLAELDRQLNPQKSCKRLEFEGGWYAVLRVPATKSDEELAIELLNSRGVYVHPGHFYDFPSDGFLILSLITMQEDFAAGVKLVLSIFQNS
jgi:aspartate/methionine/tyrosine aminotransferase